MQQCASMQYQFISCKIQQTIIFDSQHLKFIPPNILTIHGIFGIFFATTKEKTTLRLSEKPVKYQTISSQIFGKRGFQGFLLYMFKFLGMIKRQCLVMQCLALLQLLRETGRVVFVFRGCRIAWRWLLPWGKIQQTATTNGTNGKNTEVYIFRVQEGRKKQNIRGHAMLRLPVVLAPVFREPLF